MDPDLRDGFDVTVDAATSLIGLGDECLLWHVTAPRSLVVRAAPPWRSVAELQLLYRVAAALRRQVPEVVTPLSDRIARWRDRVVTIWPYVPGRQLDRDNATDRAATAGLLARLHRAALAIGEARPRPASNAGGPSDWPRPTAAADVADAELDATLDRWHSSAAGLNAPRGAVHGDFYRRNVHVHDGRLALLDWDDVRLDVLAAELAWAAWEFSHDSRCRSVAVAARRQLIELDVERVATFLDDYRRAGGPAHDAAMIVPWIRERLRYEIVRNRSAAAAGEYHDKAYEAMQVRAFATLRTVTPL